MNRQPCTSAFAYIKLSALTISALLLSACLGGGQPVRPATQIRAENLLNRGVKSGINNDMIEADRLFSESLALSSSIEDKPAMAMALINKARICRLNQELGKADKTIDAALALIEADNAIFAEAAHEKALIELALERVASAEKWALKAVQAEKGDETGRRLNLLARIKLGTANRSGVETLLKKALASNAGQNNEEAANSLRMLGILAREESNFNAASKHLTEALELDKTAAVSSKIALDLEELALTCIKAGQGAAAVGYLQRAYNVNLGAGRTDRAADNQRQLASIFESNGDRKNADAALKAAQELEQGK